MQELALNWTVVGIIFSWLTIGFGYGFFQSLATQPNNVSIFVHIHSGVIALGQGSPGTVVCIVITSYFEKIDALAIVMLYIGLPIASTALLRYYPEQIKQILITIINRFIPRGKP